MFVLCGVADWRTESQAAMAPSKCGLYGTPTPWDPSQVWWYAQWRLRPRQPPAPSPISGLLDSAMTPGSGGGGGESAVAAAQGYFHFKLNHALVTVPVPPFRGAYNGPRRNRRSNYPPSSKPVSGLVPKMGATADELVCVHHLHQTPKPKYQDAALTISNSGTNWPTG
ncbi:unnamed protein product [Schistocephalus solidus]|uniref:Uncharacterized protein n=1 Tax=Schistocephalus solidus TaxID=70667 RepID=A0A183SPY6_SCHSO|nr:unnamed protein product [Schistocephalus solidus]